MARNKTVAMVGALAGFSLFIVVGLLPSLMYGGYAGLLLAGGIFGTPVPSSLAARGLVGLGMVLGVLGTASIFTVAGAACASLFGFLLSPAPEAPRAAHARGEAK